MLYAILTLKPVPVSTKIICSVTLAMAIIVLICANIAKILFFKTKVLHSIHKYSHANQIILLA